MEPDDLDDVDWDAAMANVSDDMMRQAMAAKAKRYAPKAAPEPETKAEEEAESDESAMPTEGELAALLGE